MVTSQVPLLETRHLDCMLGFNGFATVRVSREVWEKFCLEHIAISNLKIHKLQHPAQHLKTCLLSALKTERPKPPPQFYEVNGELELELVWFFTELNLQFAVIKNPDSTSKIGYLLFDVSQAPFPVGKTTLPFQPFEISTQYGNFIATRHAWRNFFFRWNHTIPSECNSISEAYEYLINAFKEPLLRAKRVKLQTGYQIERIIRNRFTQASYFYDQKTNARYVVVEVESNNTLPFYVVTTVERPYKNRRR